MTKIKRVTEDMGSGSGSTGFRGTLFNTTFMNYKRGPVTEIESSEVGGFKAIQLEGHHIFKSDKKCFQQLEYTEITMLFELYYDKGVKAGKSMKQSEIASVLGLKRIW